MASEYQDLEISSVPLEIVEPVAPANPVVQSNSKDWGFICVAMLFVCGFYLFFIMVHSPIIYGSILSHKDSSLDQRREFYSEGCGRGFSVLTNINGVNQTKCVCDYSYANKISNNSSATLNVEDNCSIQLKSSSRATILQLLAGFVGGGYMYIGYTIHSTMMQILFGVTMLDLIWLLIFLKYPNNAAVQGFEGGGFLTPWNLPPEKRGILANPCTLALIIWWQISVFIFAAGEYDKDGEGYPLY